MEDFSPNNSHSTEDENFENARENFSFPPKNTLNIFASYAKLLGIFSVFCAFFNMFFATFICGGMAIILAILSKGYHIKMERNARIGFISGILGIVFQISLFIFSIYNILYVPEYRERFNHIYEQLYGESLDDSLDELLKNLGLSEMNGENL